MPTAARSWARAASRLSTSLPSCWLPCFFPCQCFQSKFEKSTVERVAGSLDLKAFQSNPCRLNRQAALPLASVMPSSSGLVSSGRFWLAGSVGGLVILGCLSSADAGCFSGGGVAGAGVPASRRARDACKERRCEAQAPAKALRTGRANWMPGSRRCTCTKPRAKSLSAEALHEQLMAADSWLCCVVV